MKVSYLIGVYNKVNYISDCIVSILKEETAEIEIEICIVDDGSTDGSFNLIYEKFHFNPKIKNPGNPLTCRFRDFIITYDVPHLF